MTDLAKLLEPIRPDLPTGEDVRSVTGDVTIAEIKRLREEQIAAELEGGRANWAVVARNCEEALSSKTKDLEIAAWLCEALAHTGGFAGVRDGITYLGQLLDAFWSGLHPGLESGEIVLPVRARPLNWLGSPSPKCFLPAVRAIPFATGQAGRAFGWRDYESSLRVDAAKMQTTQTTYQELIAAGNIDGETWNHALDGTPADRLAETVARLQECSTALEELEKRCGERFGEAEAPNLLELRDLFSAIREHVQQKLAPAEQGDAQTAEGDAQPLRRGPLGSRQDAVRQLGQVAAFFRETEPHSPVSYLVERAARWAAMPLADLYREVVKSPEVLARIWETLGIEPPPENR